jgi:hypothetical protein
MSQVMTKRKVLVILSNRFAPSREPQFLELVCKPDGTILQERRLRRAPRRAMYDEVWRNNDGKQSLDSCTRISRLYRHPLEKPKR